MEKSAYSNNQERGQSASKELLRTNFHAESKIA